MFINFVKVKKMKLENLNLVELNAQESIEIDGGIGGLPQFEYAGHIRRGIISCLSSLGFLAGLGDGIRDGIK